MRFGNNSYVYNGLRLRTIGTQRREGDRIIAYADHLEPGVYSLHYLA
ncbi:hypothetical protein [Nostoc sp. LPT]|nr:hypothetical protein [Nostoc sp. LPT]MBN4000404.1 hypothetical protein [Nostoc sp. LPT]